MKYNEVIKWLFDLETFGVKLGLKRIVKLLELMGNPERKLRVIHVGGTNGKGSVCSMLSYILSEAGYKVGFYSSPHLHDVRERLKINNNPIPKKRFLNILEKVKDYTDLIKDKYHFPTFFEVLTAAAFQYFYEEKVDFAILEVGLGGMLDATNVTNSSISVITNVELDHTRILGKTYRKIAKDKASIIKKGSVAITAENKKDALDEIKKKSKKKNSKLVTIGKFRFNNKSKQVYDIYFDGHEFKNIYVPLLGEHQIKNTAVVLATIEELRKKGSNIRKNDIENGLKKTKWAGRSEIVQKTPIIFLDAAHNPAGIKALKQNIKENFKYNKLILMLGIKKNKDYETMMRIIGPIADKIICTQSKINPLGSETLTKEAKKYCKNVSSFKNVKDAVRYANKMLKVNDMLCVAGSLFTVAEAREIYKGIEHGDMGSKGF